MDIKKHEHVVKKERKILLLLQSREQPQIRNLVHSTVQEQQKWMNYEPTLKVMGVIVQYTQFFRSLYFYDHLIV